MKLAAQREDTSVQDDAFSELFPLLNWTIWLGSVCGAERTLEEALHELQRRLVGELVAQSILEPLLVLHLGIVEVGLARLLLRI